MLKINVWALGMTKCKSGRSEDQDLDRILVGHGLYMFVLRIVHFPTEWVVFHAARNHQGDFKFSVYFGRIEYPFKSLLFSLISTLTGHCESEICDDSQAFWILKVFEHQTKTI